jgi:glycosyltransferase involved in cell wall biosynthesis
VNVAMISFDPAGGHPLYVDAVLTALAGLDRPDLRGSLVAPRDLEVRFRNRPYPIHDVLPSSPQRGTAPRPIWRVRQAWHFLRTNVTCLRWLKRQNLDVIHFQTFFWLSAPFVPRYRRLGIPLFLTIHNIRPHKYSAPMPPSCEDALSRWMWRQYDGLFVHTDELRNEAIEFLGPHHPPIFVSPHGLFLPSGTTEFRSLRERFSWKKMLFFGNIRRDKGLHTALTAMKSLEGFHLTIAGERVEPAYWQTCIEPLLANLRTAGKSIEIIDRFVPEEETANLFARHSFVLLPYTPDFHSQSGVLHLAMGMNTPIVATDVGGIQEILSRCGAGETALPESADALVAAVTRLYTRDPADLEANLQAARERLSWSRAARVTAEAYETVLKRRGLWKLRKTI